MFVLKIPAGYAPLELKPFDNVAEKINAILSYLKIYCVFCQVENERDMKDHPNLDTFLQIDYILIPGGQTSYIRSILSEWINTLISDLNDFIYEDMDYNTIKAELRKFKIICKNAMKENDTANRLKFPGINFLIEINKRWQAIPLYHLRIGQNALEEINEQYQLRKVFFQELTEQLDLLIQSHEEITNFDQHPYIWESENATFEIAQLLHAIKLNRLKLNPKIRTSPSKFYEDFYKFFGLTDKGHHQKLQDIRKKEDHRSYLHDFAKCIDDTALGGKTDISKKEP